MIFDSHVHTEFSADSDMKAAEALRAAEQRGIGMVFTEHLDLDYPGEQEFMFSAAEYWQMYLPLRGQNLSLGVEIGMRAGYGERNCQFLAQAPFDQVIGSIHLVDGQDIYYESSYAGCTQQEIYHRYLSSMARLLVEHSFVDVLGHIDYISRYAPYAEPGIRYDVFSDEIDHVLQTAVQTDTVLELNTRRLNDRLAMKELVPIYKRYYELGGRYVTIGSDAHTADAIGASFAAALDFAAGCHLLPVTFCERKMRKLQ